MDIFQYKTAFFGGNSPFFLHFQSKIPKEVGFLCCNLKYLLEPGFSPTAQIGHVTHPAIAAFPARLAPRLRVAALVAARCCTAWTSRSLRVHSSAQSRTFCALSLPFHQRPCTLTLSPTLSALRVTGNAVGLLSWPNNSELNTTSTIAF